MGSGILIVLLDLWSIQFYKQKNEVFRVQHYEKAYWSFLETYDSEFNK